MAIHAVDSSIISYARDNASMCEFVLLTRHENIYLAPAGTGAFFSESKKAMVKYPRVFRPIGGTSTSPRHHPSARIYIFQLPAYIKWPRW